MTPETIGRTIPSSDSSSLPNTQPPQNHCASFCPPPNIPPRYPPALFAPPTTPSPADFAFPTTGSVTLLAGPPYDPASSFPPLSTRFIPSFETASPTGWRRPPCPTWPATRLLTPSWRVSTCSTLVTLLLSRVSTDHPSMLASSSWTCSRLRTRGEKVGAYLSQHNSSCCPL